MFTVISKRSFSFKLLYTRCFFVKDEICRKVRNILRISLALLEYVSEKVISLMRNKYKNK